MVSMVRSEAEALTNGLLWSDAQGRRDGGAALGSILRSWKEGFDERVLEGLKQLVLRHQTQGSRLPPPPSIHCMLYVCRWQTRDSLLWLIPITNVRRSGMSIMAEAMLRCAVHPTSASPADSAGRAPYQRALAMWNRTCVHSFSKTSCAMASDRCHKIDRTLHSTRGELLMLAMP